MMMYPITITPINAVGAACNPPSAIAEAASTDVPIMAPPAIRREVSIGERSLNPTPKATKNKIIDDVPNVLPRSSAFIGRKPSSP